MKSSVIAIAGGIGSGKSEVVKYLQDLGYCTLDCDLLAKEIATRPQVVEQVRQLLGDEYILNGRLNRKSIREKIFADETLLKQYNTIFFNDVKRLLCERIADMPNEKYIFVEISVFDAFDYPWDEVWLVEANDEIRIDRAAARDGSSRKTLQEIISRQRSCIAYALKIENNDSLDDLKKQVDKALQSI